jgi:probable rRNA maturation factor
MISVQINESLPQLPSANLEGILEHAALRTLLKTEEQAEVSLSIVLTGDEALQELNSQYLGIDAPTDVLSFSSNETDPDTDEPYLGDVLISYPRALAQAQAGGHPVEDELQLLAVHGVLHLLNYDHDVPSEKERMWAVQAEVLQELGCSISGPPVYD